jgi:predicted SnoaL-like aldol condensation-catalyzing enzyme
MIADGDLVVMHSLITTAPSGRATATIELLRLETGTIAGHRDMQQPVPEAAANDNTMV